MTISKIKALLPVPDVQSENENCDWVSLSKKLGMSFPEAYIEFVSTYGTGSIGGFIWVLNPFSSNPSLNLEQAKYFLNAYQILRDDFPQYYSRRNDEFLPWGFTDNGDTLVWLTDKSEPNEWRVCIQAADPSQEEVTGLTTQEFLEAILENGFTSDILPKEFLDTEKQFIKNTK